MTETPEETLFVVILRYLVPLETILENREEHLKFLDKYYAKGIFHSSGPQVPRYGGVLIAKAKNRDELLEIVKEDPFYSKKLGEYQITEFKINKCSEAFRNFMAEIN